MSVVSSRTNIGFGCAANETEHKFGTASITNAGERKREKSHRAIGLMRTRRTRNEIIFEQKRSLVSGGAEHSSAAANAPCARD